MIIVRVFQDELFLDGSIQSGPCVDKFEVEHIDDIPDALNRRYPSTHWQACADGKDGRFENSNGELGPCLVTDLEDPC